MGTSPTTPSDWMLKTGNGKDVVYRAKGGWFLKHPNGNIENVCAMDTGVDTDVPLGANIYSINNPADGTYTSTNGDILTFEVKFDCVVKVNKAPSIEFDIGVNTVSADYVESLSSDTVLVFQYVVGAEPVGAVSNVGGTGRVITALPSDIVDVSGNDVSLTFPSDYTDPNIDIG